MKFAHEFQAALLQEGFPPHWVESAVPYGPLKKVIKKVRRELEQIGFNPAELADGVAFQYDFDGDDGYEVFKPKLTLYFKGDQPVNATLSTDTRKYLKILAASRGKADNHSSPVNEAVEVSNPGKGNSHSIPVNEPDDESLRERYSIGMTSSANDSQVRRVEIPLRFDVEFFGLLQEDVTTLDALQAREQKAMTEKITALSKDMANLTSPSKFTKTDMYRWRELFDIYLQAQIFFSTREQDHGSRSSAVAARQLGWFQNEVTRRGLLEDFKLPASLQAFGRFVTINITLLQNLKFQEMNQKAIGKILKKFDKRTQLGATNTFPKLIQSDAIMSETMAKAVCAQVTEDIVGVTPQIDDGDYTCPICSTISWRPIRLACQHVLCSKCTVHLQSTFKYNCPICRTKQVVKQANEDNIDEELIRKLKKYFPKETREKRIQLETEDGIATFGPTYKHPSEDKCKVM